MILMRIILPFVAIGIGSGLPAKSHRGSHGRPVPPEPRFDGVFDNDYNQEKIANGIKSWSPNDLQNVWELSGLHEGDIMIHPDSPSEKNGLLDATARWPGGVVPFFIQEDDFDRDQIELIKEAMQEYHEKTCLRFRPYKDTDEDYVTIQAKKSGCWSLVGRHGHGQVLNLQNPGCVHHGVVVHELMHALGFYHQQSAADRDEWVTIHWENIKLGTITPKKQKVKLGQRDGLSEKDVAKVQAMYKEQCDDHKPGGNDSDSSEEIPLGWLFD